MNAGYITTTDASMHSHSHRKLDPFKRKSLTESIAESVKTLFSRRVQNNTKFADTSVPLMVSTKRHSSTPTRSAIASIKRAASTSAMALGDQYQECNRYTEARAQALAETVRRLHSQTHQQQQQQQQTMIQPVSPIAPSSADSCKTLPCFHEEDEYEDRDSLDECMGTAYVQSSFSKASTASSNISTVSSSASSSRTFINHSHVHSYATDCEDSKPSSPVSTISRRHSLMLGDSRETIALTSQQSLQPQVQSPSQYRQPQHQRYSVATSQNFNRRFQTRMAQEYEQRIYCLHAHYTDTIERLESRARQSTIMLQNYERQLCELRKTAEFYKQREPEIKTRNLPMSTNGMSKKVVEFIDHYQAQVRRLAKETAIAQEWVVTLAELTVGPKRENQSWDDWLGSCLDTLQKRQQDITKN